MMEVVTLECGHTRRIPFKRVKPKKLVCVVCADHKEKKIIMRRVVKGLGD